MGFNEATAISCGDRSARETRDRIEGCFNEATAISCGDLHSHSAESRRGKASTRPQRLAVEINLRPRTARPALLGFNEATAISCGDRHGDGEVHRRCCSFNEATAISCGDPYREIADGAGVDVLQRGHSD